MPLGGASAAMGISVQPVLQSPHADTREEGTNTIPVRAAAARRGRDERKVEEHKALGPFAPIEVKACRGTHRGG